MSPRRRLPSLRALAHALAVAAGWLVFAAFWWRVFGQHWEARPLELLVFWAAVLFPLVTGSWIVHNVLIYKRRGPRRAVPPGAVAYERDFYGRRIDSDWAALREARAVQIAVDGEFKRYTAALPQGPA